MFATDQKRLAQIAEASPNGLAAVCKLAVLSAQMPFAQCDKAMKASRTRDWNGVPNITATKRMGCEWLDAQAPYLHRRLIRAWIPNPDFQDGIGMLMELLRCPGLGMVKAGFAMQMLVGVGGCLDTHNLRKFGIDESVCRPGKQGTLSRWKRGLAYLALCKRLGGTEALWNDWCVFLCQKEPSRWESPAEVSEWHVEVVDGMPY